MDRRSLGRDRRRQVHLRHRRVEHEGGRRRLFLRAQDADRRRREAQGRRDPDLCRRRAAGRRGHARGDPAGLEGRLLHQHRADGYRRADHACRGLHLHHRAHRHHAPSLEARARRRRDHRRLRPDPAAQCDDLQRRALRRAPLDQPRPCRRGARRAGQGIAGMAPASGRRLPAHQGLGALRAGPDGTAGARRHARRARRSRAPLPRPEDDADPRETWSAGRRCRPSRSRATRAS